VLLYHLTAAGVHAQSGKRIEDRESYQWFAVNLQRVQEPTSSRYVRLAVRVALRLTAIPRNWERRTAKGHQEDISDPVAAVLALPVCRLTREAQQSAENSGGRRGPDLERDSGEEVQLVAHAGGDREHGM
jgi:hypothetical protein